MIDPHVAAAPDPEADRLATLRAYGVLDTDPEEAFDDLTMLAARLLDMPITSISLVDKDRLWFKSRTGLPVPEMPRAGSFCDQVVQGRDLMEVQDAHLDERFSTHPVVTDKPGIRYYAGCPLQARDGQVIGSFAVLDRRPRRLTPDQQDSLQRLARQAMYLLELRRTRAEQRESQRVQRRLALVAERTHNVVVMADAEGLVTWVNEAFTRVTGYQPEEVVGRVPGRLLQFEGTDPDARAALGQAVRTRTACQVQILNRGKQGQVYWMNVDLQPLYEADGRFEGFVAIETDITELVLQRERAQTLLSVLPVGVLMQSAEERIVQANAAAARILGVAPADLTGLGTQAHRWQTIDAQGQPLPDDERPLRQVLRSGQATSPRRIGITTPAGQRRWLDLSCVPLPGPDGQVSSAITCFADVTENVRTDELLRAAMLAADLGAWTWDSQSSRWKLALNWAQRFGEGGEDLDWLARMHPDDLPEAKARLKEVLRGQTPVLRIEFRMAMADGRYRWLLSAAAVTERSPEGRAIRVSGVLMDIDERKRTEAQLALAASTDALTGLPNRSLLQDRLERALATARRRRRHGAVLFLDLDHFKRVNDSHGHAAGDALLCEVARRLQGVLRAEDTLARMGGDELMVLLPDLDRDPSVASDRAGQVAAKLQDALRDPIEIGEAEFQIGASVGTTIFPKTDTETAEDLVREADTAMYEAKHTARGTVRRFENVMLQTVAGRLSIERDLQRALAQNRLTLHLQGKWFPDGTLAGAEALTRWHDPVRGHVSPVDFIPVAEDSGLIIPLGRWVIEQACQAVLACQARGHRVPIAVNVSPRQFSDPGFQADLKRIVQDAGLEPAWLTLELTEGMLAHEGAPDLMAELAAQGFRFAIDDFGTGYSNLLYLKKLPVHELKIDRAFVRDLADDPDDATLVQAILDIARNFRIQTVAEGVETPAQADFLIAHGCRQLQGYLFDRPRSAADFVASLAGPAGA